MWWIALALLVLSLVPLGFACYYAFSGVENPGVQDCGSPVAFVAEGRTNERLPQPGDPEYTPDVPALNAQPRCTERIDERLLLVAQWGGAFVGMAMLGAVLGLIDDRLELRRAPKFETLLREPPPDAPGPIWDRPVVPPDDLGERLPEVEGADVEHLVVWGLVGVVVVPAIVAGTSVLDVLDRLQALPTVLAVVAGVLATVVVAAPLLAVSESMTWRRAVRVAVAAGYLTRALPEFGWSGVAAHALAADGTERERARRLGGVLASSGAVALALVGVVGWFVVVVAGGGSWPRGGLVLVLATLVGASTGLVLLPVRRQRLVFPLDRSLLSTWSELARRPASAAAVAVSGLARPLLEAIGLLLAVQACGGDASSAVVGSGLLALAIGAVVPTPSGAPVVECVSVLSLSAVGVDPAIAAAATVVWRLATYWLPVVPGAIAARRL